MDVKGRRAWSSVRLAVLAGCVLLGTRAEAQHYTQDDLVSDQPGATFADGNLVNPWGLARSSTSAWWVANNGTGTATLYNGSTGAPQSLVVTVPSASDGNQGVPTGTVFNGSTAFTLVPEIPGSVARFLFVTLDGSISGWSPALDATHAVLKVKSPGAAYTGAAIAAHEGAHFLYVANFAQGRIEVFDSAFRPIDSARQQAGETERRQGPFQDPHIPRGFAPFNVQNIGGDLYVTFAKRDPVSTVAAGPGLGYVDVFSPTGRLLRRLEHGPWLNAPWGVALAPGDFGAFSHNLLVGQFRSGEIAAYDVASGAFVGKMLKSTGDAPVAIEGLWALAFGNGFSAGPLNGLFFTAGVEQEKHGVFGLLFPIAAEQLLGNGR